MGILRKRNVILAIAVILVAAAGVFAAVRFFGKEDARELYFKAESQNFNRISQWLNENYTSFQNSQRPYKTTNYKRHMELTADMTSGGKPFGLKNADRLYDLVKRSKLVVDTMRQPTDDTAVSDITLLVERVPFIDTKAFTKSGKLYFTIPVIMPDRYFSTDLNRLDEVYDRFSVPVRPKRLVNAADIAQTLQFDKSTFDRSLKELGDLFSRQIGKDSVKFGDIKESSIADQSIKGRLVQVTLDASAATDLIGELIQPTTSDDALLAFTYGNFADLSTLLDDAGLFRLSEYLDSTGTVVLNENEKKLVAMLNVRKNMAGFRNSLKAAFEGYSVKNGLQMAVIIDKGGNIIDRTIRLDLAAKDGSALQNVVIHSGCSNTAYEDVRNRFFTVTVTQKASQSSSPSNSQADSNSDVIRQFSIVPVFEKSSGSDSKGQISISLSTSTGNGSKSGTDISLDITGTTDAQTLKRNDIVKFQVKMYGTDSSNGLTDNQSDSLQSNDGGSRNSNGSITGELNRVSWKNKKLNTTSHTVKLTVNADLPTFGIKDLSAVVNMAGEDKLDIGPVVLPEVKQEKLTDLNTVTDEELNRIKLEAAASFGTFYLTNKPVFDAILGQ